MMAENKLLTKLAHVFRLSVIASRRAGALPPMENKPKSEEILNAIIPPREWIQGGKYLQELHFC